MAMSKATAKDVRELRAEILTEPIVMPDQIDPGTSIDIYDGRKWVSGWVLVGCAFRVHEAEGDHFCYKVYQYPSEERSIPVTFVKQTKESWFRNRSTKEMS